MLTAIGFLSNGCVRIAGGSQVEPAVGAAGTATCPGRRVGDESRGSVPVPARFRVSAGRFIMGAWKLANRLRSTSSRTRSGPRPGSSRWRPSMKACSTTRSPPSASRASWPARRPARVRRGAGGRARRAQPEHAAPEARREGPRDAPARALGAPRGCERAPAAAADSCPARPGRTRAFDHRPARDRLRGRVLPSAPFRLAHQARRPAHRPPPPPGLSVSRVELERAHRYRLRRRAPLPRPRPLQGLNDTFGHPAGDRALTAFARLRDSLRGWICRPDGRGQFAACLVEADGGRLTAAGAPARPGDGSSPASSVDRVQRGARRTGRAGDADALFRVADQRLYNRRAARPGSAGSGDSTSTRSSRSGCGARAPRVQKRRAARPGRRRQWRRRPGPMAEVDADLVGSAGLETHVQLRVAAEQPLDLEVRDRLTRRVRVE